MKQWQGSSGGILFPAWFIILLALALTGSSPALSGPVQQEDPGSSAPVSAENDPFVSRLSFHYEEKDAAAGNPDRGQEAGDDDCIGGKENGPRPKVAIIIDDMGYQRGTGNALLDLDLDLTFSFLPHGPFTTELAQRARDLGRGVLVHMPMEARDPAWDPGPGTLYLADSPEVRLRNTEEDLDQVPYAIGVNNHMGSRFTESRDAMQQFLELVKERNLFFVDSETSSRSIAMETARSMGIKTARRNVFLDNVKTREDICHQIRLLVRKAEKRGWAIGIGHPNEETLQALLHCREMLLQEVVIVNVRELVE